MNKPNNKQKVIYIVACILTILFAIQAAEAKSAKASNTDVDTDKVAVCHNGRTLWVSENALDAHLAHGDFLGTCEESGGCEESTEAFEFAKVAESTADTTKMRKNGLYQFSADYQKDPEKSGIYINAFVDNEDFGAGLENLPDGEYHGRIELTAPDGQVIVVEVVYNAKKVQKAYYKTYIELSEQH